QTVSFEAMKAVVDAAHAKGRRVAIHSYGPSGVKDAVRAGADSVEHGIDLDDETIAEMVKRGTVWVPTIDHNRYYVDAKDEYGFGPRLRRCRRRRRRAARRRERADQRCPLGDERRAGGCRRAVGWVRSVEWVGWVRQVGWIGSGGSERRRGVPAAPRRSRMGQGGRGSRAERDDRRHAPATGTDRLDELLPDARRMARVAAPQSEPDDVS